MLVCQGSVEWASSAVVSADTLLPVTVVMPPPLSPARGSLLPQRHSSPSLCAFPSSPTHLEMYVSIPSSQWINQKKEFLLFSLDASQASGR